MLLHIFLVLSLFYVFVCLYSSTERVRPSGAPARGREDHCGGNEEQRADGY